MRRGLKLKVTISVNISGVAYKVVPFAKGTETNCYAIASVVNGPYKVVPFAKGTETSAVARDQTGP